MAQFRRKTCCHQQKRKYITYRKGAEWASHGHRQHAQKLGKDRACSFGDILAERQTDTHTDVLITILSTHSRSCGRHTIKATPCFSRSSQDFDVRVGTRYDRRCHRHLLDAFISPDRHIWQPVGRPATRAGCGGWRRRCHGDDRSRLTVDLAQQSHVRMLLTADSHVADANDATAAAAAAAVAAVGHCMSPTSRHRDTTWRSVVDKVNRGIIWSATPDRNMIGWRCCCNGGSSGVSTGTWGHGHPTILACPYVALLPRSAYNVPYTTA